MKRSIGIVGTGSVGTSIAISVLHTGIVDELLLCDKNTNLALGETMDLAHGASLYSTASIKMASINEMENTDVIVIAAGRAQKTMESRLDLMRDNAKIIHDIGKRLTEYQGIVVMVSNPVDILTKVFVEASGLPAHRVIGTGTMLDSARLKQHLGQTLNVDPHSVHAQVIGEHGDSEVILWSSVRIGGLALDHFPHWDWSLKEKIDSDVRFAAYKIIEKKGVSNHAVGLVTGKLLKSIIRNEHRIVTVSHVQNKIKKLEGIAISLPTVIGSNGAIEVLLPELSTIEKENLMHSSSLLKNAYTAIENIF